MSPLNMHSNDIYSGISKYIFVDNSEDAKGDFFLLYLVTQN